MNESPCLCATVRPHRARLLRAKHLALTGGLALIPLLLAACHDAAPAEATGAAPGALERRGSAVLVPEASPVRTSLRIEAAASGSIQRPLTLPAVIEADPGQLVKLAPPVTGRILQLLAEPGRAVRAGETLFTLDSADMALASGDANKADAALALARQSLARQRDLDQQQIGVRRELEQSESDLHLAEAEAQRAHARLAQLGGASDTGGGRRYTQTSPISGRIIEVAGARGAFWGDTTASIMTVADLSRVWAVASAGEKDLAALSLGQTATLSFDAYGDETMQSQVRQIAAVLDPDTRTVKVRIPLPNPQGRLRPGMFAKVMLSGPAHTAVTVPETALVQSGFDTRVFVETAPWTFEPRVVRTAAKIGDRVEITEGLKAGERIVVKDGVLLND